MYLIVSAILAFVLMTFDIPDYKIKKGKVLKDKVEIGSVSGKVGMARYTDLTFSNSQNKPVLTIEEHFFETNYPGHEKIIWMAYSFHELDMNVIIETKANYVNEKQLIKYEFENRGIEIYKDGFHRAELSQLIADDYSQQLHEDTIRYCQERDLFQKKLAGDLIERDYSSVISFRPIPQMDNMYWINQGHNLKSEPNEIGRFAIIRTINPMENKTEIVIMKRLTQPIERDGEEVEFLEAGYILMDQFPALFTYQDGVKHRDINFNSQQPIEEVYYEAIKYMVQMKYL